MIFSSESLQALNNFFGEGFFHHLSADFGSAVPNYRAQIRENIVNAIGCQLSDEQKLEVLDLSRTPSLRGPYVSISHTKDCGVWVAGPQPVGIDLERCSRISNKIINRISTPDERPQKCVEILWAAKEAAFKALSFAPNLEVIEQIKVTIKEHNQASERHEFSFTINNVAEFTTATKATGFAIWSPSHVMAVVILENS